MHIGFVRRTTFGTVALLEVDNPPVNVLSAGVPEDIVRAVKDAELDSSIEAIVLRGAGRTFIVGADLTLLQRAAHGELEAAADLHDLLSQLEDCSKPVVMAIHGNALGGGLELAMAGPFRGAVGGGRPGATGSEPRDGPRGRGRAGGPPTRWRRSGDRDGRERKADHRGRSVS